MKAFLAVLFAMLCIWNAGAQDLTIRRAGGSGSDPSRISTNAIDTNQFTFDTALHIKSGALITNVNLYGITVITSSSGVSINVTSAPTTNVVDLTVASATNILNAALTILHATNGVTSSERTHVRWLWAGGADRTLTIPTAWKTNVYSAVPPTITNGTITKMYVTSIGDTASSANQSNVFVSFEYYK